METIENNKLIAEFIGRDFIAENRFISRLPEDFLNNSDCYKCFHNSWDWLIPVIQKITNLEDFQEWEFKSLFWDIYTQIDITEIYKQVVIFLEYL